MQHVVANFSVIVQRYQECGGSNEGKLLFILETTIPGSAVADNLLIYIRVFN